jgi:hypothetical protein
MPPQADNKSSWTPAPTSLNRANAVRAQLETQYEIADPRHIQIVLQILDGLGLFHEVTTPESGELTKDIKRRAKREAKRLGEQGVGQDHINLEKQKILSETYQTNRQGRFITRRSQPENRETNAQGRRSEPEVTRAVQILDRYLREACSMRTARRMNCLGDILQLAMELRDLPESVIERVRSRLKEAQKNTPLDDVDYYEAIGRTSRINEDRQKMFLECISLLDSPETSTEEKKTAEDTRRKLFPFDWSRLR